MLHASSLGVAILYDLISQTPDRRVAEIRLVTPGEDGPVARAADTIYSCAYSLDPNNVGRNAALERAHRWARAACSAPAFYVGAFPQEPAIWQ